MRSSLIFQWKALSTLAVCLVSVTHSQPIGDSNGRASSGSQNQASHRLDSAHRAPLLKRMDNYPSHWYPPHQPQSNNYYAPDQSHAYYAPNRHSWNHAGGSYAPQQAHGFASASYPSAPFHRSDEEIDQEILDFLSRELDHEGTSHSSSAQRSSPVPDTSSSANDDPVQSRAHVQASRRRQKSALLDEKDIRGWAKRARRFRDEPEALENLRFTTPSINGELRKSFKPAFDSKVLPRINARAFAGKLNWIDFTSLPKNTRDNIKRAMSGSSRVLPYVRVPKDEKKQYKGVVREVRMTVHGGDMKAPGGKANLDYLGKDMKGRTFYNFWGVVEGRGPRRNPVIMHYGAGYVDPKDFEAVNQHHQQFRAAATNVAGHLHL